MKTLFITFTVSLLLIVVPSLRADDRKVSQLEYQNCGGYTVSEFWVNWKEGDEKKSKKYQREVRGYKTPGNSPFWAASAPSPARR